MVKPLLPYTYNSAEHLNKQKYTIRRWISLKFLKLKGTLQFKQNLFGFFWRGGQTMPRSTTQLLLLNTINVHLKIEKKFISLIINLLLI